MKKDKKQLDLDYIETQEPLTIDEENTLSNFFRKKKEMQRPRPLVRKKTTKKAVIG